MSDTPLQNRFHTCNRLKKGSGYASSISITTKSRDSLAFYSSHSLMLFVGRHMVCTLNELHMIPPFFLVMCIKFIKLFVSHLSSVALWHREREHTSPRWSNWNFLKRRKGGRHGNSSCKYGWFHVSCVNLQSLPDGGCMVLPWLSPSFLFPMVTLSLLLYLSLFSSCNSCIVWHHHQTFW